MKMRQPQRLKDTLQNKSKTKPEAYAKLPKDIHFQKRLHAGLDRDVHHVTVPENRRGCTGKLLLILGIEK